VTYTKITKQSVNTRIIRYAEVPYCDRKLNILILDPLFQAPSSQVALSRPPILSGSWYATKQARIFLEEAWLSSISLTLAVGAFMTPSMPNTLLLSGFGQAHLLQDRIWCLKQQSFGSPEGAHSVALKALHQHESCPRIDVYLMPISLVSSKILRRKSKSPQSKLGIIFTKMPSEVILLGIIFTKMPSEVIFEFFRNLLQGWWQSSLERECWVWLTYSAIYSRIQHLSFIRTLIPNSTSLLVCSFFLL